MYRKILKHDTHDGQLVTMFYKNSAVLLTRVGLLNAYKCIYTGRRNVSTAASFLQKVYSAKSRNVPRVQLPSIGSIVSILRYLAVRQKLNLSWSDRRVEKEFRSQSRQGTGIEILLLGFLEDDFTF